MYKSNTCSISKPHGDTSNIIVVKWLVTNRCYSSLHPSCPPCDMRYVVRWASTLGRYLVKMLGDPLVELDYNWPEGLATRVFLSMPQGILR